MNSKGNVYIADSLNNRVLQFDSPLTQPGVTPSTSFSANGVFGQASFSSTTVPGTPSASSLDAPVDVKVDDNFNVYVADFENSRVLVFDTPNTSLMKPPPSDPAASSVIGQKNFAANFCQISDACISNASGVAIDASGNVFAADLGNNRVLEYNGSSLTAQNNTANAVLGQAVFDMGYPNLVDGKGLAFPPNVTIDPYSTPNHIYVSDGQNTFEGVDQNRVLAWYDAKTFMNGQAADLVFGQPDFYHVAANTNSGGPNVLGPDTLQIPGGMTVDNSSNLYIVDSGNNRVLEYDNPFQGFVPGTGPRLTPPGTQPGLAGDTVADRVFGNCGSFTVPNNCVDGDYADMLEDPVSVAFDPKNGALYVSLNSPEAVFEYNSPLTSQTANQAFGTCGGGFESNNCSTMSDASLSSPTGLAVDAQGNLYVADVERLLMYLDPLGSAVGCPANSDGSGCPGDTIADKAFGTCGSGADGTGDFTAYDCSGTGPMLRASILADGRASQLTRMKIST